MIRSERVRDLKEVHGIGYCNITKCCTKVCPEGITITDNAIIPLKEHVIDQLYDPIAKVFRYCAEVAMFDLKTLSREAVPQSARQSRALPPSE